MASQNARAKSILFLSADLVGSTSYKQEKDGWQLIFLGFYREFPQMLGNVYREHQKLHEGKLEFTLWKAIGDELIFEVPVTSEADISDAVRVWLKAMEDYESDSLRESKLALKGGAFIATFPGPDSESSIPRAPDVEVSDNPVVILNDEALKGKKSHTRFLYDYFGPSVDTGFRIAGHASRRYFTMTVEVIWAIAKIAHSSESSTELDTRHHVRDVVFRGREFLKGVWRGQEYPIFAIDRECETTLNKAFATLNGKEISSKDIAHVCEACSETDGWPSKVYLPNAQTEIFRTPPQDAMKKLRETATDVTPKTQPSEDGEALEEDAPLG
ncbi:hypothetical protein D9V32_05630 [Mycetocola tolaasinivorans]|uniref:Guanylate cyclase domain-containing protein n=1 Tax=Mycetocola tolaasinivorans TaxID=76635 RepID=A0A3L7A9S5_9MICO|nr:hypothetical protein [Mycetocola tolaasinivorans]RLP76351.1 hypothetical protein D9V32_05630 [Mycetocola tolaasinivorans]